LQQHDMSTHKRFSTLKSDLRLRISSLEKQVSEQKATAAKSIFQLKTK
jgi:hypothetical protein